MNFSVSPVVSVAVSCKNSGDLDKLRKGLILLSKSDPLCKIKMDKDTGEIIISGAGELHLEICVQDLQNFYTKGIELNVSKPVVPYRETITDVSQECLAKSSSGHNRIFMKAEPISEELSRDILDKKVTMIMDPKDRARFLADEHGWNRDAAYKIWDINDLENPNILVNETAGVQYLNEVKDTIKTGFLNTIEAGPLCDEPIHGCRFNLIDGRFHQDNVHRGAPQVIPPTRRAISACLLTGKPRLLEPMFLVEITCPSDVSSKIYGFLSRKRGEILSDETDYASDETTITGYLPVAESIGFADDLRGETGGKAFPQCSFSHWAVLNSDPFEEDSIAYNIVRDIRKRKGLSEEPQPLSHYLDKL